MIRIPAGLATRCLVFSLLALADPDLTAAQPAPESDRSRQDSLSAFRLGIVEVVGRRPSVSHGLSERRSGAAIGDYGARDLAEILPLLTGVVLQRVGPRNETGLRVRGFDMRHVPLFVDGIPVVVPYDGLVDLSRFVTNDVAEVSIATGFSSLLYGPNALAGAVNVVTREPAPGWSARLSTGLTAGGGHEVSASLGARSGPWFANAGAGYVEASSFLLSRDFRPVLEEDGGRRENAAREDLRINARVGFNPRPGATYALGYVNQSGEKGNPPYAGDTDGVRARYWRWPEWDKRSLYLLADQDLGRVVSLRGRLYYDQFDSALFGYDDNRYATQNAPSSFRSYSDDDTYGGMVAASAAWPGHTVGVAVQVKQDRHVERDEEADLGRFEDVTWSLSAEDELALGGGTRAVFGVMASARRSMGAEWIDPAERFAPGTKRALDANVALVHSMGNDLEVFATASRRTRYPTMKDRFSYRQGRALPNPGLEPEQALNGELGLRMTPVRALHLEAVGFVSRIQDVIQAVEIVDPRSQKKLAQLQNAGRARHVGAEFSVRVRPSRRLEGGGSYAYVHLANLSDPDLLFTHNPAHSLSGFLHGRLTRQLSVRTALLAQSGRHSRIEGTTLTRLDGSAAVDLGLVADVADALGLEAGFRNVFDANYELVAGYPEAGRTFYLRLRAELSRPAPRVRR